MNKTNVSCKERNAKLHTGDSRYTRFRYPQFYFSIMKSINILSAATVEAAAHTELRAQFP
jgi:hypothetical protein